VETGRAFGLCFTSEQAFTRFGATNRGTSGSTAFSSLHLTSAEGLGLRGQLAAAVCSEPAPHLYEQELIWRRILSYHGKEPGLPRSLDVIVRRAVRMSQPCRSLVFTGFATITNRSCESTSRSLPKRRPSRSYSPCCEWKLDYIRTVCQIVSFPPGRQNAQHEKCNGSTKRH
jgi:hypothetical protein